MFKKYLSLFLTVLVINLSFSSVAFADTKIEKDAKFAQKVKTEITKLGTGTEAKIQVKLKDGTKLKGYISNIGEESFSVTDEKTGASTEVPYPNAKQVKGNNLSTGAKVAIVVGVIVALSFLIVAVSPRN
ncbi:MAG TPA: hypothetical protein PKY82_24890 [Pyrinomonadaceae bacterium]|nr:hypothetical protein [Pyrinomonadaceae bacterium]